VKRSPSPEAHPRVVVIGSSCAGKSTFARSLAAARACEHVELDELFWGPNWTPKPQPEFLRLVTSAAASASWVASGNYSVVRSVLWSRATTVVWLNYSLRRVLWRGVRRTVTRAATRQTLFHGNRESFRRAFLSSESILWWILSTHRRRRREFEALRASGQFNHLQWLEARHPQAAAEILHSLQNAG